MRYSYPEYERKEILRMLAEIGVLGLTEEHLMKPTVEIVWPIYENFVDCFMGIPREELQQPVLAALDQLRNEELYDEAFGNLSLIRAITKLMVAAGARDFSTRDIFRPEPLRTGLFLSAVLNFALFRSERALVDLQEDKENLIDRTQQLKELKKQHESSIAEKEAERKAEEPQVQSLEEETKELEKVISNLNKQQAVLQSEIRTIKQELNGLVEKIASEKSSLAQIRQEGFQLRTQIVQSPDKLQKMLEDKKMALEQAEARVEAARQSVLKWQSKSKAYTKAKNKAKKCLDMIETLEKQITSLKRMAKEYKDMKLKLKSNEERSWSVRAQTEEIKIESQHFQDLLEKLNATFNLKCQEADKETEDFSLQTAPLRAEHELLTKEIAVKELRATELRAELARRLSKKDAMLKQLREEAELMHTRVLKYSTGLVAVIDAAPATILDE